MNRTIAYLCTFIALCALAWAFYPAALTAYNYYFGHNII